ncbi:tripartite tricarboxylate transporter TctB family protein [Paenibacillus tarimensis]|uniref:tripartite tricarboxylate transporter TctB family protein n=1 Tax=Paenibacillus tarimensis TaxID=416012 RepID=UPI001F2694E4|nr:tripartite tricarboxylate transporter TctB family protein [Paenibacillus tarimensis]MCF2944560.1 tripartite tricarboxylate transporter TctB family protein [Paenibacillus tarimensis]
MRLLNKDVLSAIVLLAVSAVVYLETAGLNEMSAVFPRSIGLLLGVLSVIYLVFSLLKPSASGLWEGTNKGRLAAAAAGIAAYAGLIWLSGFLIASILMMFSFISLLGGRESRRPLRLLQAGAIAILVSGFFFVLFKYVFIVPLPVGILFGA